MKTGPPRGIENDLEKKKSESKWEQLYGDRYWIVFLKRERKRENHPLEKLKWKRTKRLIN